MQDISRTLRKLVHPSAVATPADAGYMRKALDLARAAARGEEVPIGALVVRDGRIIGTGHNLTRTNSDPTAHAEMVALRAASRKLKNERLLGCDLYVTLEPCAMCAGAIVQARIARVVYGAPDPKAGACGSVMRVIPNRKLNHRPTVVKWLMAEDSAALLKGFFRARRRSSSIDL
jgi:tRNA(adenine34) deaminase